MTQTFDNAALSGFAKRVGRAIERAETRRPAGLPLAGETASLLEAFRTGEERHRVAVIRLEEALTALTPRESLVSDWGTFPDGSPQPDWAAVLRELREER